MTKVAQAKDIIHLFEREEWSKRKIAKHLGISRGTVDRVVDHPDRYLGKTKGPERAALKMTSQVMAFIDAIIESDKKIHRKQRHTSKRIWERVVSEFGEEISPSESTVRRYVGKVKRRNPEPFIPLSFLPGQSMQGDFGEITAKIGGEVCKVQFWAQRLSYSRATCVSVYPRAHQEAFLDGQQRALQFFDGVPVMHVIDNLKAAIKSGVGKDAVETERYDAFQAHYGFRTEACNGYSGNEKGQVESIVGYVQRNWFSGLPEFDSWGELIAYVDAQNERYLKRQHPEERGRTVGDLLEDERRVLRTLPPPFPCCKEVPASASKVSLVIFDTNQYSIPTEKRLESLILRAYPWHVEVVCDHEVIATHARSYGKRGVFFELQHYLTALRRKPRALPFAKPFQRARLEPVLLELLSRLREFDPDRANQRWVEIAIWGGELDPVGFLKAVERALELDRLDMESLRYLHTQLHQERAHPKPEPAQVEDRLNFPIAHESINRFSSLLVGGVAL